MLPDLETQASNLFSAFQEATGNASPMKWTYESRDRRLAWLFDIDLSIDAQQVLRRRSVLSENPLHDSTEGLINDAGRLLAWACREGICSFHAANPAWTRATHDIAFAAWGPGAVDLRLGGQDIVARRGREKALRDRIKQREQHFVAQLAIVLAERYERDGSLLQEPISRILREEAGKQSLSTMRDYLLHEVPLWRAHEILRLIIESQKNAHSSDMAELARLHL